MSKKEPDVDGFVASHCHLESAVPVIARINTSQSPLLCRAEAYNRDMDAFVRGEPTVYDDEAVALAEIESRGLVDVSIWTDELLEQFSDRRVTLSDLSK